MKDPTRSNSLALSIGALSRATGVPANTLRTWERRYGYPRATVSIGSQRAYPPETVGHLRLVVKAIAAGCRPGQVVTASSDELERLLAQVPPPQPVRGAAQDDLAGWLHATRTLNGEALARSFGEDVARLGLPAFLRHRALPFLRAVGDAWEAGDLEVFQEHFASARLSDFLGRAWRTLSDVANGTTVVCAAAPGDRHDLGLRAAACLVAVNGHRVVYLGADVPVAEVRRSVEVSGALTVVFSASGTAPQGRASTVELRSTLPSHVRLFVGGAGSPCDVSGTTHVPDVMDLDHLLAG